MSFIRRGFLYVFRKRTKTLILFLILLVLGTFVLSGLSIKNATETAQLNVRQALGGVFALNQNTNDPTKWKSKDVGGLGSQTYYDGAPLTVDLADKIAKNVEGIKGYNATYTNYTVPKKNNKTLKLVESEGDDALKGIMGQDGDFNSSVSTYANSNTSFNSYFAGGYLKLTQGRHLKTGDKNVVLVSKEIAKLNKLAVGDKITLQMPEYKASAMGYDVKKAKAEVEIVGIFEPTAKSTTQFSNWSMDNAVFSTLETVRQARPDMENESYEHIHFYVNDPAQMDNVISNVKKLEGIDPTDFTVDVDNSNADSIAKPLKNMDRLITILIALIVIVGMVILYLVLASRVKERIHETGVLLSLGVSKAKIIGQYLLEVILVAVLAFSLSVLSSGVVAQTVGNQLLDYTLADTATNEDNSDKMNGKDGNFIAGSDDFAPKFEEKNELTKIRVSVNSTTVLLLCLVGFAVICVSVILAALPMLRLKPKQILSAMS